MELDPVNTKSDPSQPLRPSIPLPLQKQTTELSFAAVVENMAEAFLALDETGCCTYLNQTAERLFGGDRTSLLHKTLWDLFQVDATTQLYKECQRALIGQLPANFEAFFASLKRWFAVRLLPVPSGLAAYFQDITERKETEVAWRKEQEFLKVLLDNVQAGIIACDAEGQLKLFNQAARSFHNRSEQPLPPEEWASQYNLYRPDGKTLMQPDEVPLYRALQGQRVHNVEMMIIPKQKAARLFLVSGQAIWNPEDEKQGAVVVMHDITEQRQIETALRASEAQLSSIFQTIPDGILILDPKGQIVTANPAAEQILSLTHSDMMERVYNDPSWAITSVDGTPFPEDELPFAQVMRTGNPVYDIEHAIAHADGTNLILSINASPLFDTEGGIANVIAAISDITKRNQIEVSLRESEERYRSVIEAAAEGIVLQHADGSIFTCNASAERILGLTADQMMGRSSLDPHWGAIHEDGSPFPGEQHPAMLTLRTGTPQSNVIMGIHKPDGTLTWISINTRPLFQCHDTTPFGVVCSFFDVTDAKLREAERQQVEVALRITEQRYRSVVDHVKEVIFQSDATGVWTFLNPAWTEITGFLVEESLGTFFLDYVHPDDRQRNLELFQPLMQQQKDYCRHEVRYLTKAGGFRWVEAFARLTLDDDGTVLGTSGTLNDITERKQADEERVRRIQEQTARALAEVAQSRSAFLAEVSQALASSLEYEQTLQSVARLAVPYFADWCCVDLLNDDGTISRVAVAHSDPEKVQLGWELAQRFPRCLEDGYGISQVMKTGQTEIAIAISDEQLTAAVSDPEYLEILRGVGLRSCILAPLQTRERVLGSISFVFTESHRQYERDDLGLAEDLGRRAAIAIDNARLYHAAQQATKAAETAADRTARLQTVTAALSESLTPEQVIEVIVEQSMAALDADAALVVLVSQDRTELEIVKAVGYQAELVESWSRFSIDTDVPLAEAVRTGTPMWVETLLERIARYPHLAEVYSRYDFNAWIALPLIVEGRSVGGMLLSFKAFKHLNQDDREFILALSRQCAQAISRAQLYEAERSARAEAEQANRVKDEFLAVLSHELRSPLNPILGWTKLLRSGKLQPDKVDQALATVERNAKLQAQLIEDLLDISRMLRGKLSLNIAPVDLTTVIQGAIETVQLAASAKSIQIQTRLQTHQTPVLGDTNRLQQVLWNLLSNAIKFTPNDGHVTVQLEEENHQIQIQVIDTGKGIDPNFMPYIFEYFRQADSSTTRHFGGLGLGLAIARQIVELHGGNIQAESPGEGLGATFTVRLPLREGRSVGAWESEGTIPTTLSLHHPLTGLQILVVDDDADMRDLAEFVLLHQGAHVKVASSAVEALCMLADFVPDVLLCDIGMPDMDGYALMRQIRERPSQAGGGIRAIALTAYAGEYDRCNALAAGFQQHVSKPIDPDVLVSAIVQIARQV